MTAATGFAPGFLGATISWLIIGTTGYCLSRWAERRALERRLDQRTAKTTVTSAKPIVRPISAMPIRIISERRPFVMLRQ